MYNRVVFPYDKRGAWVDVKLWIKDNTPIDAMFITPPYLQSFRVFSERGTIAEWKDGTQQFFDTEYSFEWWERITDLGKEDKAFYDNTILILLVCIVAQASSLDSLLAQKSRATNQCTIIL